VAVTGVTGYIATEIVAQLLSEGFNVRGTVRSAHSEAATTLATLFPKLQLFEADLLQEGSFDPIFAGVDYVLHTASPFPTKIVDAQKEVIEPAVAGTKNVLESVAKSPSIKKVVITSSAAAVVQQYPTDDGTKIWTEDDWNTTSSVTEGPYRLSKTLAERYAYEWAEKHPQVIVASILPTFVIGPPRSHRSDATSIKNIKDLLNGTSLAAGGNAATCFGAVDVRDVARAHIAVIERNHAKGRYIVSSERGIPRVQYGIFLKKEFPDWPIPVNQIGEVVYGGGAVTGGYSREKARKELGIEFIPFETSLKEMALKMIELGIVTKPH